MGNLVMVLKGIAPATMASSLTQHGITWTFDTDYVVGQFVTGDWWVKENTPDAGVTIVGISPSSYVNVEGRTVHGSNKNPTPMTGRQGYDSQTLSNYSSDMNIALGVDGDNPLVLNADDSLISSVSRDPDTLTVHYGNNPSRLWDAAVLTIVGSTPASGSFRPPYANTTKTIYNESSINWEALGSVALTASAPSLASVTALFARPHLHHVGESTNAYTAPIRNQQWYGEYISWRVGNAALILNSSDYTQEQKRDLMLGMIQLGIDTYGVVLSTPTARIWPGDGGHGSGRKYPVVFAGKMLGVSAMENVADAVVFGEDVQTFYVTQDTIDEGTGYTEAMLGMPEWGVNPGTGPGDALNNSSWTTNYRRTNTARAWVGFVLAAHIMGLKTSWDHDALFDYQDRYMAITNGDSDPFGYTVPNETDGWRSEDAFMEEMWDEYRGDY